MEQSSQPQPVIGVITSAPQIEMVTASPPVMGNIPPAAQANLTQLTNQHQLAYQQVHQFHHQQQQHQHQQLQEFWASQMAEMEQVNDFKNHSLPLARIKKIMKADEDVRMISAEAPVIFAKACEMFILELTLRAWLHTEENKRRTLQKNDIAAAITRTDIFDFLVDIVPRDDLREDPDSVPYYYVPVQPEMAMAGTALYTNQQPMAYMWQQPQVEQQLQQQQQQTSDGGQD